MKKWLFNPFVYVAGAKSLVTGWIFIAATACICYLSKTHFNGIIGCKRNDMPAPLAAYFIEALVDWGCITLVLYLLGRAFSKSAIRLIDVAGTQALARWPMIFAATVGFGIKVPAHIDTLPVKDVVNSINGSMIALGMVTMVFVIWMIALMYNAFTVSCNIKGGKATGIFIAGLLVAELLSIVLFHLIYNHSIM
jgi:hypothetical protein